MSKQDRNGVRTAQDLERKYDFSSIKKNVQNSVEGLNKVNKMLDEFVSATVGALENIQNQIDGNITTYFYSGVPSLSNLPASEWTTDELKNNHLGDLYYDQDTGYAYRFVLTNGVYAWAQILDNDVAEALAIANSAKDTADGKRRVFVAQPTPPYDNGDLWIYDKDLYVCQTPKATGEAYDENDFVIATKYTDDSYAEKVAGDLSDFQEHVVTNYSTTVEMNSAITKSEESILATVDKTITETKEYADGIVESAKKELNSSIEQTAESITSVVEEKHEEAIGHIDDQLLNYSTTEEMNSVIEQTASSIKSEVNATIDTTTSEIYQTIVDQNTAITQTCQEIILQATENYVETGNFEEYQNTVATQLSIMAGQIEMSFTTVKEEMELVNGELSTKLSQYEKHVYFTENGIGIRSVVGDQTMELLLDSDVISFYRNGAQFGWWDGVDFHTGNIVVEVNERAQFGDFAFVPRSDGSLSFLKVGD